MRRSLLAVSILLLVACTEGTGGGSSFGSSFGSPTGAATMSSTAGGSSGPSGTAGSGGEATSAGPATDTSESTSAGESNPTSGNSGASGDGGSTTGGGVTATNPTAESSGDASGDPTVDGTPLDPSLDVPDEGESCTSPGSLTECPGIAVCRFYTAEEGRCESCDNCGNLNAPCTNGTDCDILFSCFAGRCTNFCPLGTSSCGPVENCLDIGHPTQGVCDPFA